MVLQAYTENEQTGAGERLYASAAQVRAAASNALHRGADGVCSWFAECVAHSLFSPVVQFFPTRPVGSPSLAQVATFLKYGGDLPEEPTVFLEWQGDDARTRIRRRSEVRSSLSRPPCRF